MFEDRQSQRALVTVGYWDASGLVYPNPSDLVDCDWDENERLQVVSYLEHATVARAFMGYSACRSLWDDQRKT